MQLNRQQVNTILSNAPASADKKTILDGLIMRGYDIEGVNSQAIRKSLTPPPKGIKETIQDVVQVGSGIKQRVNERLDNIQSIEKANMAGEQGAFRSGTQMIGQGAGAVSDIIGEVGKGAIKAVMPQKAETFIKTGVENAVGAVAKTEPIQFLLQKYEELKQTNPALARDIDTALNFASLATDIAGAVVAKKGTETVVKTAKTVGSETMASIAKGVDNITPNVSIPNKNEMIDTLLPLDAPDNIKTSLNPFLTNTKSAISVPTSKGYVLKTIDKITPEEKALVQKQTSDLYTQMIDSAEKFKVDRRDNFSPLEIVGKNTDRELKKVNEIRKNTGAVMGEIEKTLKNEAVDIKGTRLNTFIDEYLGRADTFGRKIKDVSFTDDFVKDFDTLTKNPTVEQALQFTRRWQNELDDMKDGFGAFKENKRTYTLIEGAVSDLKNATRDKIAKTNPNYKKALEQYRLTSMIRDEGNRLLGKEGLMGERLKGGAAAKRAVQSASDQGARQFYNTLKRVTGYDGLKEADIALQAMKDAGDYQGLSLLEANKDLYDATVGNIVKKIPFGEAVVGIGEVVGKRVMPQAKRSARLIQK
jgi:hypothetical protein